MMFVILSYDVGQARVSKLSKISKKYLHPVQRSLFEGHLSDLLLNKLKKELFTCIDTEKDSIVFYKFSSASEVSVDKLGIQRSESRGII